MKAVCIALILCMVAVCAIAEEQTAIVVSTEKADNLYVVNCMTEDGNIWSFYDTEDYWHDGDILILTIEEQQVIFAQ